MRSVSERMAIRDQSLSPPVIIRMPDPGPLNVMMKLADASAANET